MARALFGQVRARIVVASVTVEHNVTAMTREAERLGFVTRADDPRRRIVACPGAPACASAFIAARAIASEIAETLREPSSGTIHISGCAKGCAHPRPAALTIVGTENGCGIVERGTARTGPQTHVDPQQLTARLARRISEPAHRLKFAPTCATALRLSRVPFSIIRQEADLVRFFRRGNRKSRCA